MSGSYSVQLAGWVLVHFLWQGMVVLGLVMAGRRLLRHTRARLRHDVALGALIVLAVLPALTAATTHRALRADPAAVPERPLTHRAAPAAAVARAYDAAAPLVGLLVMLWTAGVACGAMSLLAGRRRLHRLCREAAGAEELRAVAASLARVAGVARPPLVVESTLVPTPLVAGWRAPVLVLPRGLAQRLGGAELRAVLLHELAHVRRRDYLVNLLQRVVEATLWFHPAVRVISRELRIEREHCCDDEAASAGAGRLAVARALVTLEELRGVTPALAVGGVGAGGGLGARVRHLTSPAAALSRRDIVAAAGLGAAAAIAVAASSGVPTGAAPASATLRRAVPLVDISASDPAGPFAVRLVGGRATSVRIAGVPVRAERLRQHGRVVEVLDDTGRAALRLDVEPDGRGMRWSPRRAPAP